MKGFQKGKNKKRFFKKKPAVLIKKQKNPVQIKSTDQKQNFFATVNKHEYNFLYLFIPLILLVIFLTVYSLNLHIVESISANKLSSALREKVITQPVVNNSYVPYISAKSAIILYPETKSVVFSKNPQIRFSMASTTKVMTALVALEYYQKNSVLTVKSQGIGGSVLGFTKGEKFIFEDLLYAMLLPSANDAAVVLVDNYPGGKPEFVNKMNQKAKDFHLLNTSFSDPTGLDDDGNFTTVGDLALLGTEAINNRELSKIVGTQQKLITNSSGNKKYELANLNRLLGFYGVNGIKTGTTEGAGEVLLTSTVQNGRQFIIVVMNSQNRFSDTTALINFISTNVTFEQLDSNE